MTSFIVQLKKEGWDGLIRGPKRKREVETEKERERIWGVQKGWQLWHKERDRKTCLWPKAFPSPNPLLFFFLLRWMSDLEEPPSEEQTAEGLRRHPKLLCEVFIKAQWLTATSSQPHSLLLHYRTLPVLSHLGRTKGRRLCIHFSQARKADRWI